MKKKLIKEIILLVIFTVIAIWSMPVLFMQYPDKCGTIIDKKPETLEVFIDWKGKVETHTVTTKNYSLLKEGMVYCCEGKPSDYEPVKTIVSYFCFVVCIFIVISIYDFIKGAIKKHNSRPLH